MRLNGKVTLITGVSQYMGPAFAKVFTDARAIVCVHDRKRADAESMQLVRARTGSLVSFSRLT